MGGVEYQTSHPMTQADIIQHHHLSSISPSGRSVIMHPTTLDSIGQYSSASLPSTFKHSSTPQLNQRDPGYKLPKTTFSRVSQMSPFAQTLVGTFQQLQPKEAKTDKKLKLKSPYLPRPQHDSKIKPRGAHQSSIQIPRKNIAASLGFQFNTASFTTLPQQISLQSLQRASHAPSIQQIASARNLTQPINFNSMKSADKTQRLQSASKAKE